MKNRKLEKLMQKDRELLKKNNLNKMINKEKEERKLIKEKNLEKFIQNETELLRKKDLEKIIQISTNDKPEYPVFDYYGWSETFHPVSVLELRDHLNKLIDDGYGNKKIEFTIDMSEVEAIVLPMVYDKEDDVVRLVIPY